MMNNMNKYNEVIELLKREYGNQWKEIIQTLGTYDLTHRAGMDLTNFFSFPERGEGGNASWRGNCSPKVIEQLLKYVLYKRQKDGYNLNNFTILDPMSGSGTTKSVADKYGINSVLYDLNPNPAVGKGSWDALKDDVEDSADLVFFHPPYHDMVKYSGNMWGKYNVDDLSQCPTYNDFIEKLNFCIKKLYMALRKNGRLAILVGDYRKKGEFHSIASDMLKVGDFESFIVKAQHNCISDKVDYGATRNEYPFIPIVTEYMVVLKKKDSFLVPFSKTIAGVCDIRKCDDVSLTWNHLIRAIIEGNGGKISLQKLYSLLESHPKSKKNIHWKERIRATIYEHKNEYISINTGEYKLKYA